MLAGTPLYAEGYTKNGGRTHRQEIPLGNRVQPAIKNSLIASHDQALIQHLQFTLTNQRIATVDHTTAGAQGSLELLDFPEGLVHVLGATTALTIAKEGSGLGASAAFVGSIGTAAAGTGDATLTSTEADLIASTACGLTTGLGAFNGVTTGAVTLNGTSGAKSLYLNFAVPDAGTSADDALIVNGTIDLFFIHLGDN